MGNMQATRLKHCAFFALMLLPLYTFCAGVHIASPGDDLQAILDSGADLALQQSATYKVKNTLVVRRDNQRIYTFGAKTLKDYAILTPENPELNVILNAPDCKNLLVKNVVFFANRYGLGVNENKGDGFIHLGGTGNAVKDCFFAYSRSGTFFKVNDDACGAKAIGNIFFGAGADCRGSGAAKSEKSKAKWSDSLTYAGTGGLVENNLMLDQTDVGIAIFCAENTIFKDNVIAAVSRESLGGINVVDRVKGRERQLGDKVVFSYKGVVIENNLVDAKGARVHIAFPAGRRIWGFGEANILLEGGKFLNNCISGPAMGYGFVACDVLDFEFSGNTSDAICSDKGDGIGPENRPASPGAFIYAKGRVDSCKLQPEFKEADGHLVHLLRCNHGKLRSPGGFRLYDYNENEARAVVDTAYVEMLGRKPTKAEFESEFKWLNSDKYAADDLRRKIMNTREFTEKNPGASKDLHEFRLNKWRDCIDKIQSRYLREKHRLPTAKELYFEIWLEFEQGK